MDIWQDIVTGLEVTLGVALLYFRFCLYETEEGHLQNALAEAWIRISDRSTRKRFGRLLANSAQLSQRLFTQLLGPRLLSLRAISITGCLVWVSVKVASPLRAGYDASSRRDSYDLHMELGMLIIAAVLFAIPLAPLIIRRRWAVYIPVSIFVGSVIGAIVTASYAGLAEIWTAIAIDYAWLLTVRRATAWALRNDSIWRHMLIIVGGVAAAAAFFMILPRRYHYGGLISSEWLDANAPTLAEIIYFQSGARFFIAAVSLVQLCVMVFGFLNWIIWAILSRVVYAAERHQLFRERKFFATIGVALLVHASTGSGWIKEMAKIIEKTSG
jgi:hypothetical protein